MSEEKNVGTIDGAIRIVLGLTCLGLVGYHFLISSLLPIYGLVLVIILIPFFLKTGITKACPIMKALRMSTASKKD